MGYRSAYGEYPSQEWNIDSFYVEQVVSINQLGEQSYLPDLWVQMTSGLCIHEDTLFVLDGGSSRLIEYDLSGDSIIAALSIDDYKYDNLYGCCTDSMGHVYIADYDSSRVYCVNTASQTFSVMQLSGPDAIYKPHSINYDKNNNRLITMSYMEDSTFVQQIDLATNSVTTIFQTIFSRCLDFTMDRAGNYYISTSDAYPEWDGEQPRVMKYNSDFSSEMEEIIEYYREPSGIFYNNYNDTLVITYYNTSTSFENILFLNMMPPPADPPQLIAPANGAENICRHPRFEWEPVQYADKYHIAVSADSSNVTITNGEIFECTTNGIPLNSYHLKDTVYYWKIRSLNSNGKSEWSELFHFRRNEQSRSNFPFYYPHPWDNVGVGTTYRSGYETNLEISWQSFPNAEYYVFRICEKAQAFPYEVQTQDTFIVINDLKPFTKYEINVMYRDSVYDFDEWSKRNDITTGEKSETPPGLIRPAPEGEPADLRPVFRWSDIGADYYQLQIALVHTGKMYKDKKNRLLFGDQSTIVHEQQKLKDTMYKMPDELIENNLYKWRIKAVFVDEMCTGWSDWQEFTVKNLSSVFENENGILSIAVYPNPVEGSAEIYVKNAGLIQAVEIYDIFGRKAASLSNGILTNGYTMFNWSTAGIAPGMYIVRASDGKREFMKKVVVR